MKVSANWIKEQLRRTMSDKQIVAALERAGIEIEQYYYAKPFNENIVVGLVKKVIQHPGADRLKIATVDDGREELTIVCGASNVREGLFAPLARVGAVLPDGTTITPAKLRGELSNGMLCSARELGLGESHDGLLELSDKNVAGTLLCDLYPAESFVDVKTAANRFDLLSVTGLAREVAAMTDNELVSSPLSALAVELETVMIASLDPGCARFMVAELEVDSAAVSPDWMVARLTAAGMRSLGLLVDVTNYIMLETAQPMHAYDASKITLPFGVRTATASEQLVTLDEQERKLTAGDLVVTAGTDIVGLAGIRGGAATEITPTTTQIYLEAATFDGTLIRASAKRANLRTDASARYERRLPAELAEMAMQRAIYLLMHYGKAVVKRVGDSGFAPIDRPPLYLTTAHADRVIGIKQTADELAGALTKLQLEAAVDSTGIRVTPPWWRPDLKEAEDLVEDVVRVVGYDKIPSKLPLWRPRALHFDHTRPALGRLRQLLSGAGLFEVMTYSFVSAEQLAAVGQIPDDHLKLLNPLSNEQAYLRTSLLPSHLIVAGRNRLYAKSFGLYELSGVFVPTASGQQPNEPLTLGVMIVRPERAYQAVKGWLDAISTAFNLEFDLAPLTVSTLPWATGRVAEVTLAGTTIGRIGQLHPEVTASYKLTGEVAYFELLIAPILASSEPVQSRLRSRYPEAHRDLTVIVPETVTWQAVSTELARLKGVRAEFGSDYVGDSLPAAHKALSLKLHMTSDDHTPTDAEITELEVKVRSILHRSFGAGDQE